MAIAAVSFTILLLTLGGSLAQDSYNILDNALEDFINDYKVEAVATIQTANTVTQEQVSLGFTRMLRPFRILLRNILRNVTSTPAESCLRASYNLPDVTSFPQNYFTQVKVLTNVSYEIANFYAGYFINCTSTYANTLNKNLERIPAVQSTLKQLVANGKLSIKPCPVSYVNNDIRFPLLNHTDACVTYYVRSLQKLRTLFIKAVEGGDIEGEDLSLGSENVVNKLMYTIPNCLFSATEDAITTANIYSQDLMNCIGSNQWNNELLSVVNQVPHIETTLQILSQLYTTKNNNIGTILSNYGNIAFLNNQLEAGKAYKNQTNLVESIYTETYNKALSLLANTSNIYFKICVYEAARFLQKQIQLRENKLRTCVDLALNETKRILSGYTNILNPLRGTLSELTALSSEPANCYSCNLFSSFDIDECFWGVFDSINGRRIALQGTTIEDFRKAIRNYTRSVSIEQFCRSSISPPNTELQNLIKCSPLLASS